MARIATDPNYNSPTFPRATAGTDLFLKEDVQSLAAAMSTHVHDGAGKGLQVTTIPASAISTGLITSAMIADGTIVAGDIADGAITSAKILDATIATGDLADSAVTTPKLAASAVHQVVLVGGSTNNPTTTSTSFVDVPDPVLNITTGSSGLLIQAVCVLGLSAVNVLAEMQLNVDGGFYGPIASATASATNQAVTLSLLYYFAAISNAAHVVKLSWRAQSGGTLTATWTYRALVAQEIKR